MAKTTIEIDVNTGDAAKSLSELKGEFKDLQNTLEKLTPGTKDYIDTLKNLGSVKNDIEDVKKELNAFADGTSNLSAFSGVLSGVVSGFEAASGAAALFGLNSGVLEEQIKNLQGVMAFSEGIKGVLETGESFKKLGNAIKSSEIGAKAMAVAQRILNAVMAANPIALIVAGLTALVGVIALVVNAMGDEEEAQNKIIAARERDIETLKRQKEALENFQSFESNLAKARGASIEETRQLEDKQHTERLAKLRELQNQTQQQIDSISIKQRKKSGDELKELTEQKKKLIDEEDKYHQEILKLIQDAQVRTEQRKTDDAKKEEERLKAERDKAKERAKKAKEDANKEFEDAVAEAERLSEIEFQRQQKQAEREQKIEEERAARLKEMRDQQIAEQIKADEEYGKLLEEKAKKEEEAAKKALEDYKKGEEEKTKLALQGLQSVQSLVDAFAGKSEASQKKAFQIKKAASLAQATIETYQAAQSAFASQMAIPTPDAPIRANIAAAIAIASGLARVAVIAKTKFEGGGGGGATGGGAGNLGTFTQGGGGGQPPQGLTAQNTVTQLNPDGTVAGQGQRQAAPMKAYVVESESRAVTERINKLSNNSKIG
jgi:chemotaxis protein histidine kinase CheA